MTDFTYGLASPPPAGAEDGANMFIEGLSCQVDTAFNLPVRFTATTGLTYADVTVTVVKADMSTSTLTLGVGDWVEQTSDAFDSVGVYVLKIPATVTDVPGPLMYAVTTAGKAPFTGAVNVVPPAVPYAKFTATGGSISPTVIKITAPSQTLVRITFSEPVQMNTEAHGALNLSNYSAPGLTLISVSQVSTQQVQLYTSAQVPGRTYNITITGIQDLDGNEVAT